MKLLCFILNLKICFCFFWIVFFFDFESFIYCYVDYVNFIKYIEDNYRFIIKDMNYYI